MKGVAEVRVVTLPLLHQFRGITERHVVLLRGDAGWGEFSPFDEYRPPVTTRWLAAALEAATEPFPPPQRSWVDVNVTIPEVEASVAARLVRESGCATAKVKVGADRAADHARVAAVREALPAGGRLRLDVNGVWDVATARRRLYELSEFELEYVEQPVASFEEMKELRGRTRVSLAVDELVRTGTPPELLREVADVMVVKVQPSGGVRAALTLVERSGLPPVVSSAVETSVGLGAGSALAAALPTLPYACGLATGLLMAADVADPPLVPEGGRLPVRRVTPAAELLDRYAATPAVKQVMLTRMAEAAEAGT